MGLGVLGYHSFLQSKELPFDSKEAGGLNATNAFLPHNHTFNSVVYTGTHDNDTTVGWWQSLSPGQKDTIRDYLGKRRPEMPWDLIELAMASDASLCVIPCQDILGLDNSARFNTPGRATGNWQWQLSYDMLTDDLARRLRKLAEKYNRCQDGNGLIE